MVKWPCEKGEEAKAFMEAKWQTTWQQLPPGAQAHLDAASFREDFYAMWLL